MKHTVKTLIIFTILAIGLTPITLMSYSKKVKQDLSPAEVRSTMKLKKYMSSFGTLLAGMEIMKHKEKNPDWEVIAMTLTEMRQTLEAMKKADQAGNYREFTSALDKNLAEVEKYGKKKDKKVFDSFEKLTNTCFQCHAAHRPSDFLIPKKEEPRISQEGS